MNISVTSVCKSFLKDIIKDGIRQGVFSDLDLSIVVGCITGASSVVLNSDFIIDNNLSVEKTLTDFREIFFYGINKCKQRTKL